MITRNSTDTTAPTLTLSNVPSSAQYNVSDAGALSDVVITSSEAGSYRVNNGSWVSLNASKQASLSLSSSLGAHVYYVEVKDASGNVAPSQLFSYDVVADSTDTIAPILTLSNVPSSAQYNVSDAGALANVVITSSETGSYRINNGTWLSLNGSKQASLSLSNALGVHTYYIEVKDASGNVGDGQLFSYDVVVDSTDTTAPTLTLSNVPSSAQYNVSDAASLSNVVITSSEAGSYRVNNGSWVSLNGSKQASLSLSSALGVHTYYIEIKDASDNVGDAQLFSYEVVADSTDTSAPTLTLSNVPSSAQYNVSDAASLSNVIITSSEVGSYRINNGTWVSLNASKQASLNLSSALGVHTYYIEVKDTSGNIGDGQLFSYDVIADSDTTPPSINVSSPSDNSIVYTDTVLLTGTLSSDSSEVTIVVYLDGTTTARASSTFAAGVTSWSILLSLNAGTQAFDIIAYDKAGNPSTTIERTYSYQSGSEVFYGLNKPGTSTGFTTIRSAFMLSLYELQGAKLTNNSVATVFTSTSGPSSQRLSSSDISMLWAFNGTSWESNDMDGDNSDGDTFTDFGSNSYGYYVMQIASSALGKSLRHAPKSGVGSLNYTAKTTDTAASHSNHTEQIVRVIFNKDVTSQDGTITNLNISHFNITYTANGGAAEAVHSATKISTKIYDITINTTSPAIGTETVIIVPASNSIYDYMGNAMPVTYSESVTLADLALPTISSLSVNTAMLNESTIGTDQLNITIDFNEGMNTSINAKIVFSPTLNTTLL